MELLLVHAVCSCWRAGRRLKHHFLSEYGFSLMMVLAAQFTSKVRSCCSHLVSFYL